MRNSIIYLKPPEEPNLKRINELQKNYSQDLSILNQEQQIAVIKSILADNYHMVLGTPGSGKTTAIVVLLKILARMKKRVLLVSFTNSAVDNVLVRLKESGFQNFIRVTNSLSSV
jgi:signal recognition particle GTPase